MFAYMYDEHTLLYTGKEDAIPGDIEGSYFYPPFSLPEAPPSDEPGMYRFKPPFGWEEIETEDNNGEQLQ